jgi:pyruvate/2-oxoglutarate/acetoin dehydrogenase E1 component
MTAIEKVIDHAADALETLGIVAEVVDLRTLRPLDTSTVVDSVTRAGRLVVADSDWAPCGVAAEVIARVSEEALDALRSRPMRVTWPDSAVPSSQAMEPMFYPGAREIQIAAATLCEGRVSQRLVTSTPRDFHGPF